MDYEKKYKEALEIAKNINNEHRAQPFDVMTRVFSELKESEDERIKSAILKALMTDEAIDILVKCSVYYEDVEAWIEKQRKSKFEQCVQEGDKIVTNEDGTRFNVSQLERVAKKEPKSAWSEEDEKTIARCIDIFEKILKSSYVYAYTKDCLSWLKSLKDRVQPHWKPSEEQMDNLCRAFNGAAYQVSLLRKLYQDLKKLKEE